MMPLSAWLHPGDSSAGAVLDPILALACRRPGYARIRDRVLPRRWSSRWFEYLEEIRMCRNIRPLYNFEPPATADEIRAASLQFVRKVSGFNTPSKANQAAFHAAVDAIAAITGDFLNALETNVPPKDRQKEAARAQARAARRFSR